MKSIIIAIILGLVSATIVCAETVIINVSNGPDSNFITTKRLPDVIALEDGAKEPFFDNGHIVFNAGVSADFQDGPKVDNMELVCRLAKSGGASHLLDVQIGAETGERGLPAVVLYTFYQLIDEKIISYGSISLADVLEAGSADSEDVCRSLGRKVAESVIRSW